MRIQVAVITTAVFVGVAGLMAAPGSRTEAPQEVVSVRLGGTILSLTPQIAYQSAVLRVTGPSRYGLTKWIPFGESIAVDLAAELVDTEGTKAGPALSDGIYYYEVVLNNPGNAPRAETGLFFVNHGVLVSRDEMRTRLDSTAVELAGRRGEGTPQQTGTEASTPEPEGVDHYDFVNIQDAQADNYVRLSLFNNSAVGWDIMNFFGQFRIQDYGGAGIEDFTILDNVRVGVGTTAPSRELHVVGDTGALVLDDDDTGEFWELNEENGLRFLRNGQNPAVATINAVGLGIHTTTPSAALHVAGSGRIDGDVALGSSRSLKTAFDQVDTSEMLARVADLPLASWRYKSEEGSTRHIGPFAEDFQRLFGLGDGETISVIDAQGVMLAAIQGLKRELEQTQATMVRRNAQIAELNSRLRALEARPVADSR